MKKQVILSLILIFILSLVFPKPSLFSLQTSQKASVNTKADAGSQTLVRVIMAPAVPKVTSIASSQTQGLAVNCNYQLNLSDNFLQGGMLNLNQPANCFSFQPVHLAAAQNQLSFGQIQQDQTKVIVMTNPSLVSSSDFSSAPIAPNVIPVLPLSLFIFAVSFEALERKLKALALKLQTFAVNLEFNQNQLQVLRC